MILYIFANETTSPFAPLVQKLIMSTHTHNTYILYIIFIIDFFSGLLYCGLTLNYTG